MASDEVVMHLTKAVKELTEAIKQVHGLLDQLDAAEARESSDLPRRGHRLGPPKR